MSRFGGGERKGARVNVVRVRRVSGGKRNEAHDASRVGQKSRGWQAPDRQPQP